MRVWPILKEFLALPRGVLILFFIPEKTPTDPRVTGNHAKRRNVQETRLPYDGPHKNAREHRPLTNLPLIGKDNVNYRNT